MQDKPLLTIAIPTYNRSKQLSECLSCISKQIDKNDNRVEVLVSDNCSQDDTGEIVAQFIRDGSRIRYIRNRENMGVDFNVCQCYTEAKGQFVVAFGDDDKLLAGSVEFILEAIQANFDCGVVHLNALDHKHLPGQVEIFNDPILFLKEISFHITFISANIINRDFIDHDQLLKYQGAMINNVNLLLAAALQAKKNIHIRRKSVVGAGVESSTGYKGYRLFTVFGTAYDEIMADAEHRHQVSGLRKEINNHMLIHFFPTVILIKRHRDREFSAISAHKIMHPIYKGYLYYWIFCAPMLFLPKRLATDSLYVSIKKMVFRLLKLKGALNKAVMPSRQV